jgi:hypothetical protein
MLHHGNFFSNSDICTVRNVELDGHCGVLIQVKVEAWLQVNQTCHITKYIHILLLILLPPTESQMRDISGA